MINKIYKKVDEWFEKLSDYIGDNFEHMKKKEETIIVGVTLSLILVLIIYIMKISFIVGIVGLG
jgi:uncharacterized membrane protein (DUF485 family)